MGKVRLLILVIAIGTGVAAYFLATNQQSVPQVITDALPVVEEPQTVDVLVASQSLGRGARVGEQAMRWIAWPAAQVPEGYVTREDEAFLDSLPQRRVRVAVNENEPIFRGNTVGPNDNGLLSAVMTPGMRAVSLRISAEVTAGGFILPDDRVDVVVFYEDQGVNGDGPTAETVLSDVRVLAIDQAVDNPEDEAAIVGRTVTLEVRPSEVAPFVRAKEGNTVNLVLRSAFEAEGSARRMSAEPSEIIVIRYGQG